MNSYDEDLVKRLLSERLNSFIDNVHLRFKGIEEKHGRVIASAVCYCTLAVSTATQVRNELIFTGVISEKESDNFIDDLTSEFVGTLDRVSSKYQSGYISQPEGFTDTVKKLLSYESIADFFSDSLMAVYDVNIAYGDNVACRLMTNLFINAMVYHFRDHLILIGHMKPEDSNSFVKDAFEAVNNAISRITNEYSEKGSNGKHGGNGKGTFFL